MDTGPVIIQATVKINEKDTEESLSKRILKEEHKIYPEAIQGVYRWLSRQSSVLFFLSLFLVTYVEYSTVYVTSYQQH